MDPGKFREDFLGTPSIIQDTGSFNSYLKCHSHSFQMQIESVFATPLNLCNLLLAKDQKLSIPLICESPMTNSFFGSCNKRDAGGI